MADNESSPPPDQKVKELIDAATRAELERWFGMPSFERLAEQEAKPAPPIEESDPAIREVRRKRAEALAAIDPAMVEWHRKRTDVPPYLIKFKATIEVRVDPNIALFDQRMLERQHTIADPSEREVPEDIRDEMTERAPQALLRDLHRPETDFTKQFELQDPLGEQRVDISATVATAMKTRWAPVLGGKPPIQEARELIHALRDDRHKPWTEIKLPNRRGTE